MKTLGCSTEMLTVELICSQEVCLARHFLLQENNLGRKMSAIYFQKQ